MLAMKALPGLVAFLFAAVLTGCAWDVTHFTPYQGDQQNWPTARGAFVSNQGGIPAYYGLPSRPYVVLGYLETTINPVRRAQVVEFAAQKAKQIGGDAIIVLGTGTQYIGTYSTGGAFASGNYVGNNVYASSTASATSIPLFAGKASVLIIKFK
jgi:hypothetical protein